MGGRLVAALVAALCAAVFLVHRTPRVTFFDNAEYVTCAHVLGINHSPGYPLYTLAAGLFARLPGSPYDATDAVNVANALIAAAACGALVRVLETLSVSRPAAAFGALAFAFSRTFWAYSGHAKVYTLNVLFLDLVLLSLAAFHAKPGTARAGFLGATAGLMLGNHNSMLFAVPALAAFHAVRVRQAAGRPVARAFAASAAAALLFLLALKLRGAAGALAGAASFLLVLRAAGRRAPGRAASAGAAAFLLAFGLPYLWMMARAGQFPPMNFWVPDDPFRLLDTIRMKPYAYMTTGADAAQVWLQWKMYALHLACQWHPLFLLAAGVAAVLLVWRRRAALLALGGLGFLLTSLGQLAVLNLSQYGPIMFAEVELWIIPSVFFLCLLVAGGASELLSWAAERGAAARTRGAIVALLFVFPAAAFLANRFYCDWSRNYIPYDYAGNLLRALPDRGVLVTHFEDTFLVWHRQLVEGQRQDVRVVVEDLFAFDWYWRRHLPRQYPDLTVPVDAWPDAETDPEAAGVVARRRLRALARANADRVFFTDNIELGRTGADFLLVPEGAVWRMARRADDLLSPPSAAARALTSYEYRGILDADGGSRFAADAEGIAAASLRDAPPAPATDHGRWLTQGRRLYRLYEDSALLLDLRLDVYCQYVLNGYAREANFAGVLFDSFGRRAEAEALWRLSRKLNPLDSNAARNLQAPPAATPKAPLFEAGLAHLQMGLLRNAEAVWEVAVEREPAAAEKAHANLVTLAVDEGRLEDARRLRARALTRFPRLALPDLAGPGSPPTRGSGTLAPPGVREAGEGAER